MELKISYGVAWPLGKITTLSQREQIHL
jgi:hypothetical protein